MEEKQLVGTSFKRFCAIQQFQQKDKAKSGLTFKDRQKKTLTQFELINKWAQMGNIVWYGKAFFTFENGMGCINDCGTIIIGTTLSEFVKRMSSK